MTCNKAMAPSWFVITSYLNLVITITQQLL